MCRFIIKYHHVIWPEQTFEISLSLGLIKSGGVFFCSSQSILHVIGSFAAQSHGLFTAVSSMCITDITVCFSYFQDFNLLFLNDGFGSGTDDEAGPSGIW